MFKEHIAIADSALHRSLWSPAQRPIVTSYDAITDHSKANKTIKS